MISLLMFHLNPYKVQIYSLVTSVVDVILKRGALICIILGGAPFFV